MCPSTAAVTRESASVRTADLVVIGAGAAGLAAAIFAARHAPQLRIHAVDGARHIGAKILVSGGSRCNVTNRVVTEQDFWGGSPRVVRHVLRAFPAQRTVSYFASLGVSLHEEADGKLFPDTNRSRTILDALMTAARGANVSLDSERRVTAVTRHGDGFVVDAEPQRYHARRVIIATGGRSLPKTGSDGFGYSLARAFGHGHVETTPALVPLLLAGEAHAQLSGVSHDVSLSVRVNGRITSRIDGALLWTHFGASGPAVLNVSRHWHRARAEGKAVSVALSLCPGERFESLDAWCLSQQRERPRAQVVTVLGTRLPGVVAHAWLRACSIPPDTTLAHLSRENRRRLVRALIDTEFQVLDSRGYGYAEVTAGGVPLDEIHPATLESRICPGLYFAGEILDVDGRLGGFNFQWAWSSGWVAGTAAASALHA